MLKKILVRSASIVFAVTLALGASAAAAQTSDSVELQPQSTTSEVIRDLPRVTVTSTTTSARTVPATTDFSTVFGVTNGYPKYGESFDQRLKNAGLSNDDVTAQKTAVVAENVALLDYDALDAAGNYYKGGVQKVASADGKTITRLVRHTAGVNNYGATIPDSVPATKRRLTIRMRNGWGSTGGNEATGLYAPPGEVVKLTVHGTSSGKSISDLGLVALIGTYNGYNGGSDLTSQQSDGTYSIINLGYVRMPITRVALPITQQTTYIGSPFGGPILIYAPAGSGGMTVDLEVEGAIEMPTWRLDEDTDAELTQQLALLDKAPCFIFTTPRGIRFTGPTSQLAGLTQAQIKGALEFWDRAICVSYAFEPAVYDKSMRFDGSDPNGTEMAVIFDPFIPGGHGGLNINYSYCFVPSSGTASSLNYDSLMTSGAWTTIHELNHSFEWGGLIDKESELANNVINSLTYLLYTNIAETRSETKLFQGVMTRCVDAFTSVWWITENLPSTTHPDWLPHNLENYAILQHAFGADTFLDIVHRYHELGGHRNKLSGAELYTNTNTFLYAASMATNYDMTYYVRDVLHFDELPTEDTSKTDYVTTDVISQIQNKAQSEGWPVFIPSGCLYACGYVYDVGTSSEHTVEMGRPFRIPYDQPKLLNLHSRADTTNPGFVACGHNENLQLVSYTSPRYGSITQDPSDPLLLTYTPDPAHIDDDFRITMKLTVSDTASSYYGTTQNVTFQIRLRQDGSASPAISSFTSTKQYFNKYLKEGLAQTTLTGEFNQDAGALTVKDVWDLKEDHILISWGNASNPNNSKNDWGKMVDGNLSSQFHSIDMGPAHDAEFIFERADATQIFNTARYKNHASISDSGRLRDYELYVGDDLDELRAATSTSPLCVKVGRGRQTYEQDPFNFIRLYKPITGKYVRLLVHDAYPKWNASASIDNYYYAFSEFQVGLQYHVEGDGTLSTGFTETGAWTVDNSVTETRADLKCTSTGSGSKVFKGTGIIIYAVQDSSFGKMVVKIDGEYADTVDLSRAAGEHAQGQQPVFFTSGFDPTVNHTISFEPETPGTDRINIEYFEIKDRAEPTVDPDMAEPEEEPGPVETDDSGLNPEDRGEGPFTQEEPESPDSPTTPATAETPETAATPATAETPATALTPDTAETPATADTPATPSTADTPDTASTPATPQDPTREHGWVWRDGNWYLYDSMGKQLSGWQVDSGLSYYLAPDQDGAMARRQWIWTSGTWRYVGPDGFALNGWVYDANKWYYLMPSVGGAMARSAWLHDGGGWYYFGADGFMLTGWLWQQSGWYYLEPGTRALPLGMMWYNGWLLEAGKWYHFESSGLMTINRWSWIDGNWYRFGTDGHMLTSTWTPEGEYVDAQGHWVA